MARPSLAIAVGNYPHTAALRDGSVAISSADLDFVQVDPISRAFAPMIRENRYQISEMAIATFLMAKAWGKPLVLLPVTLAARAQQRALLCRADSSIRSPGDLLGKTVAIRSYSQTTALWLRGTLADTYGIAAGDVQWLTFEGAHVAEYEDPPFVRRASEGSKLDAMLHDGSADAAIFGLEIPSDPSFRCVFTDPDGDAALFERNNGSPPVNHMLVCHETVAEDCATDLVSAFAEARARAGVVPAAGWPQGRSALLAPVALAARYALAQGLLPRALSDDEIWSGLPAGVD